MICYSASTVNRSNLSPGNTKNGRGGDCSCLKYLLSDESWRIRQKSISIVFCVSVVFYGWKWRIRMLSKSEISGFIFWLRHWLRSAFHVRSALQFQIQVADSEYSYSDLNMKLVNCRVQNLEFSVSFHGINVIVKDIHFQTIAHLAKL